MNGQDCEQLTLFPADSHASHSVWLGSKKARGMSATFGLKCSELSPNLRRVGSSVRTYLESCELPPGTWSRIWSVKGMTSRCLIMKLRLSERHTDGHGSRLLPTVRSHESGNYQYSRGNHSKPTPTLTGVVVARLWPTPDTQNGRDGSKTRKELKGRHALSLHHAVSLWPTPAARDYKGANSMEHLTRESDNNNHRGQLANAVKSFPTPRAQSGTGASNAPNRQGGQTYRLS